MPLPLQHPAQDYRYIPMTRDQFIYRVLSIVAFDNTDDLWWRFREGGDRPLTDADPLDFYINCNDLFWWGASDLEAVTPDTVDALAQAYADTKAIDERMGHLYGAELYCARQRKMRPQGAWFAKGHIESAYMPLFAECGPEREVGHGNPYPFMSEDEYAKKAAIDATHDA